MWSKIVYDVVSDINLTSEIFLAIGDEAAHVRGEDREGIVDTPKEWLLFISGWASLICIIVPYGMNVYSAIKIPKLTKQFVCTRDWFSKYRLIFIFLVVLSGGAYPALALVTSKLFALDIFNTGLSRFELDSLVKIRVQTTVLFENLPQLVVQIMYAYSICDISQNTVLAFCTSVASIIASVMIYFMNKDQKNAMHPVCYYFELKKNSIETLGAAHFEQNETDCNMLTVTEKGKINGRKFATKCLSKEMVKIYHLIYGNIDIANYEIAYVHVRNDNFVIRAVQQLHEEELGYRMTSRDNLYSDYNKKESDKFICKDHCITEYLKQQKANSEFDV